MTAPKIQKPDEEFDWIQLSEELRDKHLETFQERFWRKVKSNPFVPFGKMKWQYILISLLCELIF